MNSKLLLIFLTVLFSSLSFASNVTSWHTNPSEVLAKDISYFTQVMAGTKVVPSGWTLLQVSDCLNNLNQMALEATYGNPYYQGQNQTGSGQGMETNQANGSQPQAQASQANSQPPAETKMIQIGPTTWVSATICNQTPSMCPAYPPPVVAPMPVAPVRTSAQCQAARDKDWAQWCWQSANSPDNLDCSNMALSDKNSILDNIAQGYNSNQAKCMRGESY